MRDYWEVIEMLYDCGSKQTPDGVKWNDSKINHIEINEMLEDLWFIHSNPFTLN